MYIIYTINVQLVVNNKPVMNVKKWLFSKHGYTKPKWAGRNLIREIRSEQAETLRKQLADGTARKLEVKHDE